MLYNCLLLNHEAYMVLIFSKTSLALREVMNNMVQLEEERNINALNQGIIVYHII